MLRRTDVNQPVRGTTFEGVNLLPADDTLMDLDLSSVRDGAADVECLRRYLRGRTTPQSPAATAPLAQGSQRAVEGAGPYEENGERIATAPAGPRNDRIDGVRFLYDYVLIDCPPAFNAASAAALIAADDVIIPIKLDAFSLRGMTNLMRQIQNMKKINPQLRLAGLLPTMVYKSDVIREARATLEASGLPVFPPIRRTAKVDDMTFAQEPLIVSSPKSAACVDYRRFVTAYVEGGARRG